MGRGAQEVKSLQYTMRTDDTTDPTYIYIGQALPGTSIYDPSWRIKRLTQADNTVLFAKLSSEPTASAEFNKVWDNRISYTYQ